MAGIIKAILTVLIAKKLPLLLAVLVVAMIWPTYRIYENRPSYLDLPAFSVSLRPSGSGVHSIRLKLCLQFYNQRGLRKFKGHMPEVQNAFLLFISTLDAKDLEDPSFLSNLRYQLRKRAENVTNTELKDLLVTEVLLE